MQLSTEPPKTSARKPIPPHTKSTNPERCLKQVDSELVSGALKNLKLGISEYYRQNKSSNKLESDRSIVSGIQIDRLLSELDPQSNYEAASESVNAHFVLFVVGDTAGYMSLSLDDLTKEAWLNELITHPEHIGAGRNLVEHAVALSMNNQGEGKLRAFCTPHSKSFYLHLGFEESAGFSNKMELDPATRPDIWNNNHGKWEINRNRQRQEIIPDMSESAATHISTSHPEHIQPDNEVKQHKSTDTQPSQTNVISRMIAHHFLSRVNHAQPEQRRQVLPVDDTQLVNAERHIIEASSTEALLALTELYKDLTTKYETTVPDHAHDVDQYLQPLVQLDRLKSQLSKQNVGLESDTPKTHYVCEAGNNTIGYLSLFPSTDTIPEISDLVAHPNYVDTIKHLVERAVEQSMSRGHRGQLSIFSCADSSIDSLQKLGFLRKPQTNDLFLDPATHPDVWHCNEGRWKIDSER